jgi:hypothetical protein
MKYEVEINEKIMKYYTVIVDAPDEYEAKKLIKNNPDEYITEEHYTDEQRLNIEINEISEYVEPNPEMKIENFSTFKTKKENEIQS